MTGIKHSKLYSRRIYRFPEVLMKLKELGNATNASFTSDTVLEGWRSTLRVEAQFKRKCTAMTWTRSSLGEAPRACYPNQNCHSCHKWNDVRKNMGIIYARRFGIVFGLFLEQFWDLFWNSGGDMFGLFSAPPCSRWPRR
jgi:hypothetical protein